MTQQVGSLIREARKARGLTQEQLANLVHVSRQTVSHWENGRAEPGYDMLRTLAEELNLDTNLLFTDSPGASPDAPADSSAAPQSPPVSAPSAQDAAPQPAAAPSPSSFRFPIRWRIPALAAGIILLLFSLCAAVSMHTLPVYPLRVFLEEQHVAADQPSVLIYTRESPIMRKGTGESGKWEFPIFFKEQNGFRLEVTSLRLVWFRRSGSQYIETLSAEEFLSHTGSSAIGPGEIRLINIGKPAAFDLVRFGCILTGVDDSGRELSFRMTVPLD